MVEAELVIHLGLPSTFNKLLQTEVFAKHPEIQNVAKPWGVLPNWELTKKVVRDISHTSDQEFETALADIREYLQVLVASKSNTDPKWRCTLFSVESFYTPVRNHPVDTLDRLQRVFDKPFKVLITIREQRGWLESFYLQGFRHFTSVGVDGFGDWAHRQRAKPWNAFKCCNLWPPIQEMISIIGSERVLVVPMEAMFAGVGEYADRRIPDFLGVDRESFDALMTTTDVVRGRVPEYGFVLGRAKMLADKAGLNPLEAKLLPGLLQKMHRAAKNDREGPGAHVLGSLEDAFSAQEIEEIVRGNARMAELTGVDLTHFSYRLP